MAPFDMMLSMKPVSDFDQFYGNLFQHSECPIHDYNEDGIRWILKKLTNSHRYPTRRSTGKLPLEDDDGKTPTPTNRFHRGKKCQKSLERPEHSGPARQFTPDDQPFSDDEASEDEGMGAETIFDNDSQGEESEDEEPEALHVKHSMALPL